MLMPAARKHCGIPPRRGGGGGGAGELSGGASCAMREAAHSNSADAEKIFLNISDLANAIHRADVHKVDEVRRRVLTLDFDQSCPHGIARTDRFMCDRRKILRGVGDD